MEEEPYYRSWFMRELVMSKKRHLTGLGSWESWWFRGRAGDPLERRIRPRSGPRPAAARGSYCKSRADCIWLHAQCNATVKVRQILLGYAQGSYCKSCADYIWSHSQWFYCKCSADCIWSHAQWNTAIKIERIFLVILSVVLIISRGLVFGF